MTAFVGRALFPLSLVIGTALWIKGYAAVGDGFAAGAITGLGAVSQYVCLGRRRARERVGAAAAWRLLGLGLAICLLLVLLPVLFAAPPVTHVPAPGAPVQKLGLLELHTAVLFDLGVALLVYGAFVAVFDRLFPPLPGGGA